MKFKWKTFYSFGLFLCFFIILISGLMLYIAPPGRVAHWINWQMLGFDKDMWQTQHTVFSYVFAILAIFHIFSANWRAFKSYISSKKQPGLNRKNEFFISFLVIALIFAGNTFFVTPFSNVMNFGDNFYERISSWNKTAPIPYTEKFTLNEIAEKLVQSSPETMMKKLKQKGYQVDSTEQTLEEIAEKNHTSPALLYEIIKSNEQIQTNVPIEPDTGLGQKKTKEIATALEVDVELIIETLAKKGIKAKPDDKLNDIAKKHDKKPIEIFDLIEKNIQP